MTIKRPGPSQPVYPDRDGLPIAESTLQFDWIVMLQGTLASIFHDDPDVFVAGDLLWYAVEGKPNIRCAPDTLVAFGRPKGHRGSYRQWDEANIAPQVVFEVLPPEPRIPEMLKKFTFYARYGVEEYYLIDPMNHEAYGWMRSGASLMELPEMNGWVSPRLGIRFELGPGMINLYRPNGRQFKTYVELARERDEFTGERGEIMRERETAIRARDAMVRERNAERERRHRLSAQRRELGIDPE